MRFRFAISSLIALSMSATQAPARADQRLTPDQRMALRIVRRLDLTSFPNSTGPRRQPGKRTLADYGFTVVRFTSDGVLAQKADGEWRITLDHIVRPGDYWINLCFRDEALNGGSYKSVVPLVLKLRADGLYDAREDSSGLPTCPSLVLPPVR